jgi:hypothetical protein
MSAPCRYQANVAANRFGAGIGVWLVGNMVSNQLISTGAFEVYFDGQLVSGWVGPRGGGGGFNKGGGGGGL